jgi:signal transduction histidine kinase
VQATRQPLTRVRHILLASLVIVSGGKALAQEAQQPLQSVAAVRRLTPEQVEAGVAFDIVGTLLRWNGRTGILHDDAEGIWFHGSSGTVTDRGALGRGLRLRLRGRVGVGRFAPKLIYTDLESLGTSTSLPPPKSLSHHHLTSGAMDCQPLMTRGIVMLCARQMNPQETLMLTVQTAVGVVHVETQERVNPEELIDAEIRVQGVAYSRADALGRFVHLVLATDVPSDFVIERSAPEHSALRVSTLAGAYAFSTNDVPSHRIIVRATVTSALSDGLIAVRDLSCAGLAQGSGPKVVPGDEVEIRGFAVRSEDAAISHATWLKTGSAEPPIPRALVEPVSSLIDAELIQIEGVVGVANLDPYSPHFQLLGLSVPCWVKLPFESSAPADKWPLLHTGSKVRITGIASVQKDSGWQRAGVRAYQASQLTLWPRAPADIRLLSSAPASTEVIVLRVLAGATAGLALFGGGLWWRSRGRLQAQLLQRERLAAITSERQRLMNEIHDTLAQGLTVISVRLNAVKRQFRLQPDKAIVHLESARHQVTESLQAARDAINALRPAVLEHHSIDAAIRIVITRLWPEEEVKVEIRMLTPLPPLSPQVESSLLFIAQEALTNVCKHANAKQVLITLGAHAQSMQLLITDDGDHTLPPERGTGHGLLSMQERARACGGTLEVVSLQSGGTRVEALLPTNLTPRLT